MEFLSLNRRRSSERNDPNGEERGETDVFAGYIPTGYDEITLDNNYSLQSICISSQYV